MESWFELTLDTTPPVINIECPRSTIPENTIEIVIASNETVLDCNVYIIDSKGVRHNYVFSKLGDKLYTGYIDFQTYPLGFAKLYAVLKDSVFNEAQEFVVIDIGYIKDKINCYISLADRNNDISFDERAINFTDQQRVLEIEVV